MLLQTVPTSKMGQMEKRNIQAIPSPECVLHLAKKERQCKATDLGTHRRNELRLSLMATESSWCWGDKAQKMEGGPGAKSPLSRQWTEAVNWTALDGWNDKRKGSGHGWNPSPEPQVTFSRCSPHCQACSSVASRHGQCYSEVHQLWIHRATPGPAEGQCVDIELAPILPLS